MKNKQLYLLSILSTGLFMQTGAVSASPLVSIGNTTDIYFNGSSSLRWDTNVFRNETNEIDDLIFTLSPGFEINVGRGASNADLTIITRYDILRYDDNDRLDTELFHIKAYGTYKTSRLDLNASVSYDEEKTNTDFTIPALRNQLIESDNTAASLHGEYRFSPKLSFGAGIRYSDKEYTNPIFEPFFSDYETVSLPLDLFYELTPKIDLSAGYTYSNRDIDQSLVTAPYETDSNFFNVGARGNLLPKLTGFFKVGYRTRDDSRANTEDSGMLGLNADLTWAATPKVTVGLGLSRDFGVAGEGASTENTSFDLSGSYSINSYWAASANLGYTLRDYSNGNREDDQYNAGIRVSYSPNQYWRFSSGLTHVDNSSNTANNSYDSQIFDLTVSLRY